MKQNIGILGGTFDPIHEGHIAIGNCILKKFKLKRIEFIPCFQPPHREKPIASPEHRLEMIRLAIWNHKKFVANNCEIKRKKISYTIDTLQSLHQQFPDNRYYFIIGADAFARLDTWHAWEKIMMLTDIIVVSRDDEKIKIPERVENFMKNNSSKKQIHFCAIKPIPISATQIRLDILAGKEKIKGLPRLVHHYILKHKIYTQ